MQNRRNQLIVALIAASTIFTAAVIAADKTKPAEEDAAVARTRKQVRMLDDLYKMAIVTVTDKYVHKEDDIAAAVSFKAVFTAMKTNGWHEVRLIDATGAPYNDANLPKDAFEKEAIKQLKAGKASFEQIEKRDDDRVLRVATIVPVVMDKCTKCHDPYKQAKTGEAIGALSYTLKIE